MRTAADRSRPQHTAAVQTTVSLTNLLLGVGILSMPYAMTCSGASGFLSVLLCCALFCTSGHYLHRALDLMPATAAKTYPDLGAAALGPPGRHLVSVAAATGLFGSSCLLLVVLWRSVEQLLAKAFEGSGTSAAAVHSAALLCGIATEVPLCVLGSYRTLSGFSTLGCVSTAAVIALVAMLPILDPQRRYLDAEPAHHAISIDFVTATSVFAASMASTQQFATALNIAFAACAVATGVVCGVGYWYWGDSAHVLVTTDFERHSPYAALTLRGWGIQSAVEMLIALNVGTTVPLFVFALTDITCAALGRSASAANGQDRGAMHVRPPSPRVARGAVVAAVVAIALCLNRVLAGIESVEGAVCAITTSLLLPTVFCAALRRRAGLLRPRHWAAVGGMGVFGVVLMATVLGRTAMQVIAWLRGDAHSHHDAMTAR